MELNKLNSIGSLKTLPAAFKLLLPRDVAVMVVLTVFAVSISTLEFFTLLAIPIGLDNFLQTNLYSDNVSSLGFSFLNRFLKNNSILILILAVSFVGVGKFFIILWSNKFGANLAASFGERLVSRFLFADYSVSSGHESVLLARIFFGDVQVWASDFCQKLISLFERSVFLAMCVFYFLFFLPWGASLVTMIFVCLSLVILVFLRKIGKYTGERLRTLSDNLMVAGEQIARGLLEIKISKNENYFVKMFRVDYQKFAGVRALAAVLKNTPSLTIATVGQIGLISTPIALLYVKTDPELILATFITLGVVLARAVPIIGTLTSEFTIFYTQLPTLERLSSLFALLDQSSTQKDERDKDPQNSKDCEVRSVNNLQINRIVCKEGEITLGKNKIFSGVNFELQPGVIYGFFGPSGSGKTTLLNSICGVMRLDKGSLECFSEDGSKMMPRVSYAPQRPIFFSGDLDENLSMGKVVNNQKLQEIKNDFGLLEVEKFWPERASGIAEIGGHMSGGEVQRLAVARSLLIPADIYIFDEPTSSLDRKLSDAFFSILRKKFQGAICIVVTHSRHDLSLCDEVFELKEGRLNKGNDISK